MEGKQTVEERLERLEKNVEHLTRLMESSVAWQSKFGEFVDEMAPVAKAVMDTGMQELAELERRGYFLFGRDLLEALNRIVETYEPDSLPELAESFADVILVLRLLSQPKVLAAAQDVAQEFDQAGLEPIEVLGAAKRIETEKDIQRGLAFALDLFGTLGRSVSRAPRLRTGRSVPKVTRTRSRPPAAASGAPASPATKPAQQEFVFVPDDEWNRDWAEATAASLGVGPLSEDKWKIIEFSRKDYKDTKKAPNIRRITKALDISTKEVYALFPAAPGPTISKIAGVPKPAGCL